jgi:hypothetical protein
MLFTVQPQRIRLETPDGYDPAPSFSAMAAVAAFIGPSGTESSTSQPVTNQQVGVQGGTGIGANNTGTAGNSGVTTSGSGNTITVESSDPALVEAAFSASESNSVAALEALQTVENNAAATNQAAIVGNAQVSTGALQYGAGQPVGSAFSTSPLSSFSPTEIAVAAAIAFLVLILAIRK